MKLLSLYNMPKNGWAYWFSVRQAMTHLELVIMSGEGVVLPSNEGNIIWQLSNVSPQIEVLQKILTFR